MTPLELVRTMRKRAPMLGLDDSAASAIVYLLGFDEGTGGIALRGLREWMVEKLGGGTNLGWPGLVAHLSNAPLSRFPFQLDKWESESVRVRLLDLLEEFLTERDGEGEGLSEQRS
jgi:hypothetical protein